MHGRSKFNRKHKVVYDKNGFDKDGFDKDGYDRNGYDRSGFDRDGYDIDGHYEDEYVYNNDGGIFNQEPAPELELNSELETDAEFEEKFFLLGFGDS